MRDTFLLLWVGFLIIGVIGSIVSSMRKQIAAQPKRDDSRRVILSEAERPSPRAPGQVPEWVQRLTAQTEPAAPRVVAQAVAPKRPPQAKPAAAATPALAEFPPPRAEPKTARIFGSRKAIVQAVIAAEVLGKPRALRDEYF
jgi:hypothetical protein